MAYNEQLAERARQKLDDLKGSRGRKMFGGLACIVNGNMFVTVGENRIMCRIGSRYAGGSSPERRK
jgi:TfoX/Sxy family transcriptional regulator of competence genes